MKSLQMIYTNWWK